MQTSPHRMSLDTGTILPATARPRAVESGMSLLEMVLVATLTTSLFAMVSSLVLSTSDASRYTERLARAIEVEQEILNEIRAELVSSVGVFQKEPTASTYMQILELDPALPPLPGRVLPTATLETPFGLEEIPGERTGNCLLFTRVAWTSELRGPSGRDYRVDAYRIVHYYLTPVGDGPQPGSSLGLNLVQWISEPMWDAEQAAKILAADRPAVFRAMRAGGVDATGQEWPPARIVWQRGDDPSLAGTFALLDENSSTGETELSTTPPNGATSWRIAHDPGRSRGSLLTYRYFSVASNYAPPPYGVGSFGKMDRQPPGFPHGFEVQMVGESANREMLLRLCIVSTNANGLRAWSALRQRAVVRDL